MIVHFKRFSIGAADLIYGWLKRDDAASPLPLLGHDERKPAGTLAYAALAILAFFVVAALVLPDLVPAASSVLAPLGAKGLALLVGALCLALLARIFFRLGRATSHLCSAAYQRGLEIELGQRQPAWRVSKG